eukprot:CAMPEP_0117890864 /NCGR_PEP_ID=MMETSP0950-20121206/23568_1 /TAXON_ID=44440 /ORGANISM="Chattonella subsalsa, Strain CCMP2191" /LENGTH=139 /DNA_ID=CAMNT_0005750181 /DNA_START=27 /DNA_END=442 /DNA_ORIENTATION=-
MVGSDSLELELNRCVHQRGINIKDHDGKLTSHLTRSESSSVRSVGIVKRLALTLLAAGADVNVADDAGKTALHYVFHRTSGLDHDDFVREILKHGDPNRQDNIGRTPLHYITDSTDEKLTLVQQLLQSKAECNLQDQEG